MPGVKSDERMQFPLRTISANNPTLYVAALHYKKAPHSSRFVPIAKRSRAHAQ